MAKFARTKWTTTIESYSGGGGGAQVAMHLPPFISPRSHTEHLVGR